MQLLVGRAMIEGGAGPMVQIITDIAHRNRRRAAVADGVTEA
jgi:hypothetical protein